MSIVIPSLRAAVAVPGWAKNVLWRNARAVPSLDLRFADNKSLVDAVTGASLVTFARASSGTYVDSAGVIQTAATDEPRFDHNPTTGESLGLLVEEPRTNLLQRSEEFDNASWSKTGSSVSANSTTGPDSLSTADKIVEDTSTGGHVILQSVSALTDSTTYTASIFCKAAERSWVALTIVDKAGGLNRVWVNLSTGAQGTTNGTVSRSSIVAYPNGWYLLSVSASTATGVGTPQVRLSMGSADNTPSYTGDGASGIYLWGAQLEAGAFPSSYILNVNTPLGVTRSADVASITGSAFSSWYRQDEGTMFVQGSTSASASNPILFQVEDGTVDERIQIRRIGGTNRAGSLVNDGGVAQGSPSVAGFNADTIGKVGFSYALNNLQLAFNGELGTTDTSATLPTVDRAFIGSASSPLYANGRISRITYWPQALPNLLQALTQ